MNSILPKYDDLERVAEEAAIKIFTKNNKNDIVKSNNKISLNKNNKKEQYEKKYCDRIRRP